MRIAYFDCFSGAAGDMIVAALSDAGVPEAALREAAGGLGVAGFGLRFERVKRKGLAAARFVVELAPGTPQPHRHLHHVEKILDAAALSGVVRDRAKAVFRRLAEAEAKVHATTVEKVHFHEVGAIDAIVDVALASFCLDFLKVDRIVCSPIPTGRGSIVCDHGVMPVPAPATAELLRGAPLAEADVEAELTTPTGAALLTTLASAFGPAPAMRLAAIGVGAGGRDLPNRANVMRVLVGEADGAASDEVVVLEANLDDASPQVLAFAAERLLEAGGLDVYSVPIQMKKGRSGVMLCVLCEPGRVAACEETLFRETPTLGVRRTTMHRRVLPRRFETVGTRFGPIRMKVAEGPGGVRASPEYEDCREAAIRTGTPLREVILEAVRAWSPGGSAGG
ncbi:MAG: Pyridinium-3,5-bisthiocarboxylic acid mononucleotide nickel insertion protein [Phycisphaerae bacterium]|nr:Pyridinium-3,5-bisthiocarboxylic acid mononucleotide nickel insertion protein [Phycisphaerae bacterium]